MSTVLILDADPVSRRRTIAAVRYGGFKTTRARNLADAHRLLRRNRYTAVIVDPGTGPDSRALIEALRAQTDAPIVAVSASVDQQYKIAILDAGADDYLTGPVDPEELLARVRAVSRRVPQLEEARPIVTADFTMHLADRRLFRTDKTEITLSPTEWRLIEVLARHSGHLVSRRRAAHIGLGTASGRQDAVPTGTDGEHPPKDRTGSVPASLLRYGSRPGTSFRPRGRTIGESRLRHAPRCRAALSTRMIVSRLVRGERRSLE